MFTSLVICNLSVDYFGWPWRYLIMSPEVNSLVNCQKGSGANKS